jgi:hypothetical protein
VNDGMPMIGRVPDDEIDGIGERPGSPVVGFFVLLVIIAVVVPIGAALAHALSELARLGWGWWPW